MGFDKILIPLDGSDCAEWAIPFAVRVANPQARIHLLSVVENNVFSEIVIPKAAGMDVTELDEAISSLESPTDEAAEIYARQKYLRQTASTLERQDFTVTVELVGGYAANVITTVADQEFEIIVMSTHGRTGLSKILIGSVAEKTLHSTSCPVLIVPAGASRELLTIDEKP